MNIHFLIQGEHPVVSSALPADTPSQQEAPVSQKDQSGDVMMSDAPAPTAAAASTAAPAAATPATTFDSDTLMKIAKE